MNNNSIGKHFGITMVLAATLALGGCKDKNAENTNGGTPGGTSATADSKPVTGDAIVVGEYNSFTGTEATFGKDTDEGIQLAVEEVNKAGGVEFAGTKKQIQLITQDDAGTNPGTTTAVQLLLAKNPVVVLGEVASGLSKVGAALCKDKGVPMISSSSTQKSVTEIGPNIFRVCFIDPYQAAIVARYAIDGVKAKKVAIFTNRDTDYSKGFSEDFKTAFVKYGGTIIGQQFYGKADKDYKSGLSAIKGLNPDAILVPGYYQDAGSICKQAREIGITIPILGADGWSSDQLFKFGGVGLKNTFFSDHVDPNDPSPAVKSFVEAYKAKYGGKMPGSLSFLGYDAAKIAFDAMKRAKAATPAALTDALATTKDFAGASGNITIDANRNAAKSAVIRAPVNGAFTFVKKIDDPEKPL